MATLFEKLGEKCTSGKCNKGCPIYIFNEEGAGKDCHNGCMESLRFPNVAAATKEWVLGRKYDLMFIGRFSTDGKNTRREVVEAGVHLRMLLLVRLYPESPIRRAVRGGDSHRLCSQPFRHQNRRPGV